MYEPDRLIGSKIHVASQGLFINRSDIILTSDQETLFKVVTLPLAMAKVKQNLAFVEQYMVCFYTYMVKFCTYIY